MLKSFSDEQIRRCSIPSLCAEKLETTSVVLEPQRDTSHCGPAGGPVTVGVDYHAINPTACLRPLGRMGLQERVSAWRWEQGVPLEGAAHQTHLCGVAKKNSSRSWGLNSAVGPASGSYSGPLAVTRVAKVMD